MGRCDIVRDIQYSSSGTSFLHTAPKTLGISGSNKCFFLHANEMTGGWRPLDSLRRGVGCQGDQLCD